MVAKEWGEGERELLFSACSAAVLQGEKSYRDGWWCWLHIVNVLNTPGLDTKVVNLVLSVLCHSKQKKN